jgi:hypothetical protein
VAAELAKLSRWLEENPPHPLAPAPTGGEAIILKVKAAMQNIDCP